MKILRYFVTPLVAVVTLIVGVFIGIQLKSSSDFDAFMGGISEYEVDKWEQSNQFDKEYMKLYSQANTPEASTEILVKWNEKYDEKIDEVYILFNKILDSIDESPETQYVTDSRKDLEQLKKSYDEHIAVYENFAFDMRNAVIGHGTGHSTIVYANILQNKHNYYFELLKMLNEYKSFDFN